MVELIKTKIWDLRCHYGEWILIVSDVNTKCNVLNFFDICLFKWSVRLVYVTKHWNLAMMNSSFEVKDFVWSDVGKLHELFWIFNTEPLWYFKKNETQKEKTSVSDILTSKHKFVINCKITDKYVYLQ